MAENSINLLYEHYNKLDAAKENIHDFASSYLAILAAVHGTVQEKQLCSQFISKFFVHFPEYYEQAIEMLLDLCEDDDVNIRRRAIKELSNICKERTEFVGRIADVLAQLLLSEDPLELNIVNISLSTIANYDIKSFFTALFNHIIEGEEETRNRVIKFLRDRFKLIDSNLLTREVEEFFLGECKKVLVDVTKEEFVTLMTLLSGLKISKTMTGHNVLLSIIAEKAELGTEFDVNDQDFLDKLLMCIRHGSPYFSQFSPSTDYVSYLITKVLPNYRQLESNSLVNELEILQALAEIVPYISPTIETATIEQCQTIVYNLLLEFLRPPPEDAVLQADQLPETQFSHIECLLYTFHQLCKFNPNYFNSEDMVATLKDFKLRLQYLARISQVYINKLKKAISLLAPKELKSEDNKIKTVALNATTNINSLIKDFFKIPPSYKNAIQLSFKQQAKAVISGGNLLKAVVASVPKVVTPISPSGDAQTVDGDGVKEITATGAKKRQPILPPENADPSPAKKEKTQGFSYKPYGKGRPSGGAGGFRNGGNRGRGGGRPRWNGQNRKNRW